MDAVVLQRDKTRAYLMATSDGVILAPVPCDCASCGAVTSCPAVLVLAGMRTEGPAEILCLDCWIALVKAANAALTKRQNPRRGT